MLNAVKLTNRRLEDLSVLVLGLGAAGVAVTEILLEAGVRNIIGADSRGALHVEREDYQDGSMNSVKRWVAETTNPECRSGAPADVIDGADLLIGVSGAKALPAQALERMNDDAMVFAMANPNPEVDPEEAAPYVRIVATGPLGLPQPDQQRALLPGRLPRRPGRARPRHHRADEDRGGPRDRGDRRGQRAARGLHHPVGLRPRGRPRQWRRPWPRRHGPRATPRPGRRWGSHPPKR